MDKLLQGEELERRAKELGVAIQGPPISKSVSGGPPRAHDHELQRRVIEAERHIRESRLWLIAVISAGASVISAITALVAVMGKKFKCYGKPHSGTWIGNEILPVHFIRKNGTGYLFSAFGTANMCSPPVC